MPGIIQGLRQHGVSSELERLTSWNSEDSLRSLQDGLIFFLSGRLRKAVKARPRDVTHCCAGPWLQNPLWSRSFWAQQSDSSIQTRYAVVRGKKRQYARSPDSESYLAQVVLQRTLAVSIAVRLQRTIVTGELGARQPCVYTSTMRRVEGARGKKIVGLKLLAPSS